MPLSYESLFGLAERPFSLTPDPRFFFKSRSHVRALEALNFALRSNEPIVVVTGDLGVGKTTLCRVLGEQLAQRGPVCYVSHPLMGSAAFTRLLNDEIGGATTLDRPGVVVVDEAHTMPFEVVEHVMSSAQRSSNGAPLFQFVLVGQAAAGEPHRLGIRDLDAGVTTARLLPLGREECAAYITHRLDVAGGAGSLFSPRALDLVFSLSGGIPRLVNLLCERALQEAASAGAQKVEATAVDLSASALQLLRARPRRFRWYARRSSSA